MGLEVNLDDLRKPATPTPFSQDHWHFGVNPPNEVAAEGVILCYRALPNAIARLLDEVRLTLVDAGMSQAVFLQVRQGLLNMTDLHQHDLIRGQKGLSYMASGVIFWVAWEAVDVPHCIYRDTNLHEVGPNGKRLRLAP